MIDLHTHSLMSDGVLLPSELVRRAEVAGYRYWAITDHADQSNLDHIVPRLAAVAEELNRFNQIQLLPGIELTHVPPETIAPLAERARRLGARLIVVHGETIAEPVPPGTNRAAILAGVHLLAHPGLISAEEVRLAAERGVYLEVTSRKGHSLTNGHLVRLAREGGAQLVLDSDTHEPGDIVSLPQRERIVRGAGLEAGALERMDRAAVALFERLSGAGQRSEDGGRKN
jgi:putative hydrolase